MSMNLTNSAICESEKSVNLRSFGSNPVITNLISEQENEENRKLGNIQFLGCGYFWATFLKIGQLFIPTYGHTD